MLLPLGYLVVRTAGAGGEVWDLVFRARTLEILGRTVLLMVTVTAGSIALAVPLAFLTVRTDLPGRRIWSILTALPLVIPSYVGAFVAVAALGPRGMFQQALEPLGVERLPEIYGFPGAAITLTLLSYPYVLLTVRGALFRMDPALEETSRSLGMGPQATFRRVVLPQLRPAMAAGGLLVALYTLSDFGAVSLLRYETFTWAIYLQYGTGARAVAAGLSLLLVALAGTVLAAEVGTRGKARYYRLGGVSRAPATVPLGRWRWPGAVLCGLVVLFGLVMPVFVLAYWLGQGLLAGEPLRLVWSAAWNSASIAALAAGAAVMAAVPVAI
ncbi:MAG: ABC transporter permease subunit, partial [Chloroflexota bacterium]